ncbi:MAG: pyruvate kinase, partial [Clostridia bacterium]
TFIIDSVDMDAKIIHTTSQCSGKLSNHKGMYCPGTTLSLPFLTDADKIDLQFAMDVNAEAVAASFVGSGDNMREIRDFFFTRGVKNICLISKIECQNGLDNIDGIIDESDGVMVARGDLGVEVPYEKLPALQKFLITSSRLKGKFVITATEMLESMISKPRPTRAEIIDVANAVYDGSSCVMLSAETAVGIDPANAIATMARIAVEAEKNTDYYEMYRTTPFKPLSNTDAISHAAVNTTFDIGAKAIVVYTASGVSARMISRFRPSCPIIACTSNPTVYHQLSLSWGVIPCMCESYKKAEAMFAHAASEAIKLGVAKADDTILITAGLPLGTGAGTNLIKIEEL